MIKCYILKYKTRYLLRYDNKKTEQINRCILSFTLKISTDLAHLTSNGKAFQRLQSLGAAQVILI